MQTIDILNSQFEDLDKRGIPAARRYHYIHTNAFKSIVVHNNFVHINQLKYYYWFHAKRPSKHV